MILFRTKNPPIMFKWTESDGLVTVTDDADEIIVGAVETDIEFALSVADLVPNDPAHSPEYRIHEYLQQSPHYDVVKWEPESDPPFRVVY